MTITRMTARSAALALTVGIVVSLVPSSAGAAPVDPAGPSTAAEAAELATRSGQQLDQLAEQVNQAQAVLDAQQVASAAAIAQAAAAQAALAALQPELVSVVRSGYGDNGQSRLSALLTSDSPEALLGQLNTLSFLANRVDGLVAQLAQAQAAAQTTEQSADAAATAAQSALADLQAQQSTLEEQRAGYQAQFAALDAVAQARVTTAVSGPAISPDATQIDYATEGAPSAAAALAVQTALDQIGDPYITGAAGPDGFDCSGLTMYAYAAAGIDLPHSSRTQSTMGAPVARADLQPGDLVFFYSPVSHVGLYIGGGMMVHASVTGRPVAVTSVDKAGYVGARRVA